MTHVNSLRVAVAVGCLITGTATIAGQKFNPPLTVDPVNRFASGSVAGVRSSADSVQSIQCNIMASTWGNQGNCSVRTAEGTQYYCHTTNQNHLQAIASIGSTSFIYFSWDASNTCVVIDVTNGSIYGPVQP